MFSNFYIMIWELKYSISKINWLTLGNIQTGSVKHVGEPWEKDN